jgi:magnesium chelatase family protein
VLDSLRQPLETGEVTVARANAHVTFPARVQLIAAMNPCRCGHLGDPALGCSRAPKCAADYQSRCLARCSIASTCTWKSIPSLPPILPCHPRRKDRSRSPRGWPPPAPATARLEGTRRRNNELDGDLLERFATPDEAGRQLLFKAAEAMRLSARGYTRILRVARTIADLAGAENVGRVHVAEALSYRRVAPRA